MRHNLTKVFACFAATTAIYGCAGLPVSTGVSSPLDSKEVSNKSLFTSIEKQDACLANLAACVSPDRVKLGTPKEEVFLTLGMNPRSFETLTKQATQIALYGNSLHIPFEQRAAAQTFLNSLEGLTSTYRNITAHRKYGLTASRVDTDGVSATFNMVFQNGMLFNPITVIQTPVEGSRNDGYLNNLGVDGVLRIVKP